MSVINTNITSMIAQQNLSSSKGDLTTAMERLSSGLRINSAKDDAAGQAIANRMTSQITGLAQAQRNANDGISVAQTAEGALNQVNDNLQRIRELTVQAQNGTNSAEDKQSIQNEIGQRLNEINRISEETSFNGVKVLAANQDISIQVGSEDGQAINVSLEQITSATLKMDSLDVTQRTEFSENFGATVSDTDTGVTAKFDTADLADLTESGAGTSAAVSAEGNIFAKEGGGYAVLADNGNYYTVDTSDASGLTFDSTGTAVDASTLDTSNPVDSVLADVTLDTATNLSSADLTEINDAEGNGTGEYVMDNGDGTYNMATIATDGTATKGEALTVDPLKSLDGALSKVDALRSDLGAIQNRFDSAITNLSTTETNLSAARSRIEDADYASEVANMTRAQILQQAGTSVLAQANQVPQSVLSLLG
ncbi:FliC/FljB family flagellin [Halomonas sp. IOP_31]|uniref:FliC/FljB family flagellin n=1 Tax=Halomonas sp. IOP_31 TaxID=2876584 RepID=UPI001E5ADF0A|nr:FliC/FljB family flagellin [Halomonas sp. IOP_31]MCD6008710.1 FliC/FljB family flagellin [Halomonas sp. IOP_31]